MRGINEIIRESAHRFGGGEHVYDFLCECARSDCAELISMQVADYERIRARGDRFVILPGHEVVEIERVVEERNGYLVVEKLGEGRAVAIETDPRSLS